MQSFCLSLLLVVSLTAGVFSIAAGQKPGSAPSPPGPRNWENLRPEGEEFSILMPKGSTFATSKEPYHKMELNARFYISQTQNGPVFAVVSLSGIKSNPALYTEMQRVNSYVDAFKKLFVPKVRKDAIAKLALVGEKTLYGNPGREYRMTVADLSGTVNAFATRRRFYAVVYLHSKKDEALQEEFLSSFVLPEKLATPQQPVAQGQVLTPSHPSTPPPSESAPGSASGSDTSGNPNESKSAQATTAPADPGSRAPIRAGVLNGKATTLPKPQHPAEAREVSGTVSVEVTVDEMGSVIAAKATSGPQPLHQAAVNAALQAKFSPTFLMGEPVKVSGVITYNFVTR